MKKTLRIIALAIALVSGVEYSDAQVSVNVNIGAQPLWGPVGYDYARYYYLPEYDIYYDVPSRRYVYLDGSRWLFAAALPPRYATINLYSTYKVVLNEPKAYLYHKDHSVKYVKYKSNGGTQVIIKNSNEPKYYIVKGHPHYAAPPGQVKKSSEVKHNSQPRPQGHGPAPSNSGNSKGHGGGHGGGSNKGGGKGKH